MILIGLCGRQLLKWTISYYWTLTDRPPCPTNSTPRPPTRDPRSSLNAPCNNITVSGRILSMPLPPSNSPAKLTKPPEPFLSTPFTAVMVSTHSKTTGRTVYRACSHRAKSPCATMGQILSACTSEWARQSTKIWSFRFEQNKKRVTTTGMKRKKIRARFGWVSQNGYPDKYNKPMNNAPINFPITKKSTFSKVFSAN
jgi:hypothetical protein